MSKVRNALMRKLGPLPAWGWLLGGGIALYLWRNKGLSLGGGSSAGGSVTAAPTADLSGTSTALTPAVGAGAGAGGSGLDTTGDMGPVPGGGPSPTVFDPAAGGFPTGNFDPGPIDTSVGPGPEVPYDPGAQPVDGTGTAPSSGTGDTPQRGTGKLGSRIGRKKPPAAPKTSGHKKTRVRGKHTPRAPQLVSENGKGESRPGRGTNAQPASRPHGTAARPEHARARTPAAARTRPRSHARAPVHQTAEAAFVKTRVQARPRARRR